MAATCKRCGRALDNRRHWYCARCRAMRKRHKDREREKLRMRATPAERGYDGAHRRLRKQWDARVQAGGVSCARAECLMEAERGHRLILPGEPWDLGHDDFDRSQYTGPEHRRCNRATASRRAPRTSRRW